MTEPAAPTSVADAQLQAFTEHAEEEAAKTAALAEQQKADLAKRSEELAAQTPPPAQEPSVEERLRAQVVQTTGPRNVNLVMTEEQRLAGIKAAIKDHLKNVELDMTGGVGKPDPVAQPAEPPAQDQAYAQSPVAQQQYQNP